MSLRRALYFTQRTMGDVESLQRGGPGRLGKRLVRRQWRRGLGRFLSRRGL